MLCRSFAPVVTIALTFVATAGDLSAQASAPGDVDGQVGHGYDKWFG